MFFFRILVSLIILYTPFLLSQTIQSAKICETVENLEPQNPKNKFEKGERAYCWMQITDAEPGSFITLQWYCNNELEYSYNLKIKYETMRTYAYKTLRKEGLWRADIQSETGDVLKSMTFYVGETFKPIPLKPYSSLGDTSLRIDRPDIFYSKLIGELAESPISIQQKRLIDEIGEWLKSSEEDTVNYVSAMHDSLGFVQRVYKNAFEIELPDSLGRIFFYGEEVYKDDLLFGDVVFFSDTLEEEIQLTEMGIYIKDDFIVHNQSADSIKAGISHLNNGYFVNRYAGACRIFN